MFSKKSALRRSVFVVACLALATVAIASTVSWWHGLSQSQRDQLIVDRAQQDQNQLTGLQCKEWVRQVVRDASNQEVTIPSTKSNNYQWNSSLNVYAYSGPSCPPQGISPGHIIQMVWRNQNGSTSPHTAIVLSNTSSGMTWIDCNWHGDTRVITHQVSYTDFDRAVGYKYTVYKIK